MARTTAGLPAGSRIADFISLGVLARAFPAAKVHEVLASCGKSSVRRRDLSVVFMDTTSLSFYGEGGETLGEHGYSKDYRPDLKQMILALIVDGNGRPICTEMWPGNTADVTTLLPVIDRLRQRFSIGRVCVVADRGMISAATIEGLEARELEYILGARERSDAVVRKIVLENDAPLVPLLLERKAGETQLFVKQVMIEGKRYIVCRNEAEAEKDRKDREAIVAALDAQLKKGDKALIGNSAYRRYLRKSVGTKDKTKGKDKDKGDRAFEIDAGKLAEEARFDGIFVLRTNASVTPLQAVLRYRDLLQVENLFLRTKAIMRTRPIFHSSDAAIRGHVFCSFLALAMQKYLDDLSCDAASRRNGRNCCAISIGCNRCASSIAAPIGWCAPTRRRQSPPCSARPMSRCRREPDKPPRRRPRPPQNPPQNAEADPGVVPRRLEFRRKLMKIRGLPDHLCANLQGGETCFRRAADESRLVRMVDAVVKTRESRGDTARSGIAEAPLALPKIERSAQPRACRRISRR
jgi:hypothetical protein